MIAPDKIWLAVEPVDMRLGGHSLSVLVQNTLQRSPCDGTAYAFTNRARNRLKLLIWDGTGVWLCQRRLHKGRFHWPTGEESLFTLTDEQWNWLICGVEWQRLAAPAPRHLRVA
jgi:transposase